MEMSSADPKLFISDRATATICQKFEFRSYSGSIK